MPVNHTPVSHAMVGSEHIGRFFVVVKYIFKYPSYLLYSSVDHSYVLQILTKHNKSVII